MNMAILQDILESLHNWFDVKHIEGEYTIENGSLATESLQDGQYFRIVGSIFNDGLYKYPTAGLADEIFEGEIWALAIPPAIFDLCDDVEEWTEKYYDAAVAPFQTESFGGYSYSKSNVSNGDGTSAPMSWRVAFRSRMNKWRKLP